MSVRLFTALCVLIVSSAGAFENITENCIKSCSFQNDDSGEWCDGTCRKSHCKEGCRLWETAVASGCYSACNSVEGHSREQSIYCLAGCNSAVSLYINQIKEELGTLPVPVVVPGSITNTSISLKWTWSNSDSNSLLLINELTNISLQWRYSKCETSPFWRSIHSNLLASGATIDSLHPYTNYKFRLVVSFAFDAEPLVSEETSNITTLPFGAPSTSPLNLRVVAVDSERVTIAWDPPLQPNGPIISYALTLKEARFDGVNPSFRDFVALNEPRSHTFIHLNASTSYVIGVAAKNTANGTGPSAILNVTTLPPVDLQASKPSILIVIDENIIERHDTRLIFYDTPPMYSMKNTSITGVGVDARKGLVFVADDSNVIHELIGLYYQSEARSVVKVNADGYLIKKLSVDWLFDRLYLLLESENQSSWQIARVTFNGSEFVELISGQFPFPSHVEVDPFNGYLMWCVNSETGGLFTIDLANLKDGYPAENEKQVKQLINGKVAAFKGDPINGRVLAMLKTETTNKTIVSVSFDGSLPTVVRHSMSQADEATDLIFTEDTFYWINRGDSIFEEIDDSGNIHVNKFEAKPGSKHDSLVLSDAASQPVPLPLGAVLNLQVLLDSESGRLKWDPPVTISRQGRGAWKGWSYQIEIKDLDTGAVSSTYSIRGTEMELTELQPNTSYSIKVEPELNLQVESEAFVGKTLAVNQNGPIYWAASDGQIYSSSLTGKKAKSIFDARASGLKKRESIISTAWMSDILFVVTNASRMLKIDVASRNVTLLKNIEAISVAVDWLGRKIYWGSSKRQTIGRCNIDGSHQEWLPIVGIAKSLAVHSAKGKLAWSTGYAVEGAALNGDHPETFWSPGLFSGSQAIGLTVDYHRDTIYWIVKQIDGSASLYQASIDLPYSAKQVSLIHSSPQGPLHYSTGRLFWLQDQSSAVISNLDGLNAYTIGTPRASSIHSFIPCNIPDELPNVIPQAVEQSSVILQDKEGTLVISWSLVSVSHGNVSYDVHIRSTTHEITSVTSNNLFKIPKEWYIEPYEEISVTIRSFTVWSSASATAVRLRSPPSAPEAPFNPRAFVTLKGNSSAREAAIELRWSSPLKTNGILTSYRVLASSKDGTLENVTVNANQTELVLNHLAPFTNYFITVEASTIVGYGPASQVLNVSTSFESPVPRLLVVSSNDLWEVDLDDHSLSKKRTPGFLSFPHNSITYLNAGKQIFWIDNRNLFLYEIGKAQPKKLYELNGTANALVVDWISHQLYWSQKDVAGSSIYRLDNFIFSPYERNVAQRVIHDHRMISLVNVDPLTSQIFWLMESDNGSAVIMKSTASGDRHEHFFNNKSEGCSCLEQTLPIGVVTSFDYSGKEPRLFWASDANHPVQSADMNGCDCRVEFSPSHLGITGGFSSLSIDANFFAWSNLKNSKVHYLPRPTSNDSKAVTIDKIGSRTRHRFESEETSLVNTRKVSLLSSSTQPLPRSECLKPKSGNYLVSLINKTSESLTLLMPEPERPAECLNSMAPSSYVLFYSPKETYETDDECFVNLNNSLYYESSKRVVTLEKLMPYTQYAVHLVLTNFYQSNETLTLIGGASCFRTKTGAPARPENIRVIVTSPRSVRVQWSPSRLLIGHNITSYTVHWSLDGHLEPQFAVYAPRNDSVNENASLPLYLDVHSLKADSSYTFKVRAYSIDRLWTDSENVTQITYPDPQPLAVVNQSSRSVTLGWVSPKHSNIIRHFLQMYHRKSGVWDVVEKNASVTKPDHYYELPIEGLKPFTSYSFRLQLMYQPSGHWFSWPLDANGLTVTTDGAVPDRPSAPIATITPDNALELRWGQVNGNGHDVLGYVLEMTLDDAVASSNETESQWNVVYNGTGLSHVVRNVTRGSIYRFRLRAFNELGLSEYSNENPLGRMSESVRIEADTNVDLILGLCISTMSVFVVTLIGILVCGCRKSPFNGKKAPAGASHPSSTSEMTDLATLRELPRRSSFIQQSNAIYDVGDCDLEQELALLPHIRYEDLVVTRFLGRGAFGEVFEGSTSNLPGSNQYHTKVAVKTLRKGATDQEKNEFLKEAILMSHFKHDHILRLLGVCLETDPNFILLELMEGGDLLSYLRNNRPHQRAQGVQLRLYDLVSMCVDVAKGCCYLEELHFVHRDLAARNCLVSSLDPNYRVVKIGDFGLARDIYRNDYYRKEGEGLLPVRWMAPESLTDGVFTSQTDVWSFGVLLWEILTLGQQPYPARTNLQVLEFVRRGGRLDPPRNCPDLLFDLMMRCWAQDPARRPTFAQCLAELTDLQTKLRHAPCTAVHNESYVSNPTLPRDSVDSGAWSSEMTSQMTGPALQERQVSNEMNEMNECPAIYANTKEELMNAMNQQREADVAYSTDETEDLSPTSSEDRYLELLNDQSPSSGDPAFNYVRYARNEDNSSDLTDESCLSRSATP